VSLSEMAVQINGLLVEGITEYDNDELVVSCTDKCDLIHFYAGLTKHRVIIAEQDAKQNRHKWWIGRIPGIDGFLACSGKVHIGLICLKSARLQKLVAVSTRTLFGQPGALFSTTEKDDGRKDIHMVFTSKVHRWDDNHEYLIHRVTFREDVQNMLIKMGHLPSIQPEDLIESDRYTKQLEQQLEEERAKNESRESKIKELYEIIDQKNLTIAQIKQMLAEATAEQAPK